MMISRGSRPVIGFALGAGDPYALAALDLADLKNAVQQGDDLAAGGDYAGAIRTFQTAGVNAVTTLGPEIDTAGALAATQPHTQRALMLAGPLASVEPNTPTAADATFARQTIGSMLDDYLAAIQDGRAAQKVSAPKPHSIWPVIIIPAAVGGLILLVQKEYGHAHPARR